MNDKKMISIDQFNTAERVEVDEALQALMQKYRTKSGKEPDSKKEKELSAEAREVVMTAKLARENRPAERNPLQWQPVKSTISVGQPLLIAVSDVKQRTGQGHNNL